MCKKLIEKTFIGKEKDVGEKLETIKIEKRVRRRDGERWDRQTDRHRHRPLSAPATCVTHFFHLSDSPRSGAWNANYKKTGCYMALEF